LMWVVIGFALLALMYVLLTLEVVHRTVVALLVAGTVFALNAALRFTTFNDLLAGVDLNAILLIMGMMIIVAVLSRTGFFEYVSHTLLTKMRGSPILLIGSISALTALISAFIDNVTTVLLVAPIVIELCRELRVDPRPVLLATVFASNIGGTATLIGDPPNIIIGSAAGLGFMDFVRHLTPIAVIDTALLVAMCPIIFRSWFREYRAQGVREVVLSRVEVNRPLFRRVGIVLATVIGLFLLEDFLRYPPSVPAIIGAAITLVLARRWVSLEDVVRFVDWPTLVFFVFMFIAIRGIERLGVMDVMARSVTYIAPFKGAAMVAIVWISAILSAFVDNIPFVMAMIPVVQKVSVSIGCDPMPIYWALALGGCLGGNGTLVGASANIVVAGIAEKHGYEIRFREFMKYGMPVMIATVGAATLYLVLRYGV